MTDTIATNPQPETLNAALAELGLTVDCVFVPAAKGTPDKELRLNWRATVKRAGRVVLETSYTQGVGHCPAYKAPIKSLGNQNSLMRWGAIRHECETGRAAVVRDDASSARGFSVGHGGSIPAPTAADVLYCLVMDASAIDHPTYEDWAADYGYNPDFREGERVYRACLETGLKLRAALGDKGLERLREATQDF